MASIKYIFNMHNLSKIWPGGREILKDINLSFLPGAKIGVLGVNGSGKSTLLKIMAGEETTFSGEARAAEGIKIGYLPQEPVLDETKNVFSNVISGIKDNFTLIEEFNNITSKFSEDLTEDEMNELIEKQTILQEKIDASNGWDLERKVEIAMDALRVPNKNFQVINLSGGEKRRIALCNLLLTEPDLLLLDEPTNHLDAESVAWLQKFLHEYAGTVVTVTHDRYFLDEVAGWILEIDRGKGIPYEGNYSGWLEQKQKRLIQEGKKEDSRSKIISRELEWVRSAPRARQSKSKARVNAYENLLKESMTQKNEFNKIFIPAGPRLGDIVVQSTEIYKGYDNKLLIENMSFSLPPGGIIGVIGPNGAGKTTLFKMITNSEVPDSGNLKVGQSVKLGYVDQSRDSLNDKNTVWQEISEEQDELELGGRKISSKTRKLFNFKGNDRNI